MTLDSGAAGAAEAGAQSGEAGAGAAGAASSVSEIVNEKPWYGDLSDPDIKTWVEKNNPKDAESTFKQMRELQKLIGDQNRVALPKDGEDITQAAIWDKLGVPKEAAGYAEKLKRPELPEGMVWDEGFEKQALDIAAKVRAPQHVVQAFLDTFAEKQAGEFKAVKEHHAKEAAELNALLREYGADKDKNLDLARRAARDLGFSADETKAIEALAGNRATMSALVKLGSRLTEGGGFDGAAGGTSLQSELDTLNGRIAKGEALTASEMARRSELYKLIHTKAK